MASKTNDRPWATLTVLFLCLCGSIRAGAEASSVTLPAREKFHLFLLVGQSNMAGRGTVEERDKTPHPRVFSFDKNDRWVPAIDPIHFDKPVAGVCLGRTFGIVLAEEDPEITVGLIPCAAGGSPISTWEPGGYWKQTKSRPYDDAIRRTRKALERGVLKGILWHQGESDSNEECAAAYEEKLHALIARFRKELGAPDVPFIAGQLGRFPDKPWDRWKETVNAAHESLPQKVERTGFVSSEGLTPKDDMIHFDARSLRLFGRRYARVYEKLAKQAAPKRTDGELGV